MKEKLKQLTGKTFWKTSIGGVIAVIIIIALAWLLVSKNQKEEISVVVPKGKIVLTEQERAKKIETLKNISTKRINLTEEERQRKLEALEALN